MAQACRGGRARGPGVGYKSEEVILKVLKRRREPQSKFKITEPGVSALDDLSRANNAHPDE